MEKITFAGATARKAALRKTCKPAVCAHKMRKNQLNGAEKLFITIYQAFLTRAKKIDYIKTAFRHY